jgi:hypothetical protein
MTPLGKQGLMFALLHHNIIEYNFRVTVTTQRLLLLSPMI